MYELLYGRRAQYVEAYLYTYNTDDVQYVVYQRLPGEGQILKGTQPYTYILYCIIPVLYCTVHAYACTAAHSRPLDSDLSFTQGISIL